MNMNMKENTVGERIRIFREGKRLTQNELAAKIGTTPQNIYKYEQGIITNIPITRIAQIAAVLDVPPARIAGWDMEITVHHDRLPDPVGKKFNRLDPPDQAKAEAFIDGLLAQDKYNSVSSAG